MKTKDLVERAKPLVIEGAKIGGLSAFLSSVVYSILFIAFLLLNLYQSEGFIETLLMVTVVGGYILCVLGILPTVIIGITGGAIIGLILGIWIKKLSNFAASFIGLLTGMVLLLIANYLFWSNSLISIPSNIYISFFQYITAPKIDMYTIPNIIAIIISAYLGWKINKVRVSKSESEHIIQSSNEEK